MGEHDAFLQGRSTMKIRALFTSSCLLAAVTYALSAQAAMDGSPKASEASKAEITVLYDAFGKPSAMKKDWGFSALIEYGEKRINNP